MLGGNEVTRNYHMGGVETRKMQEGLGETRISELFEFRDQYINLTWTESSDSCIRSQRMQGIESSSGFRRLRTVWLLYMG